MAEAAPSPPVESRWLAGSIVVAVITLMAILPERITVYPVWVTYVLGLTMIVPMVGAVINTNTRIWETIERISTMIFVVVVGAILLLFNLVQAMALQASEITGIELLASSSASMQATSPCTAPCGICWNRK